MKNFCDICIRCDVNHILENTFCRIPVIGRVKDEFLYAFCK